MIRMTLALAVALIASAPSTAREKKAAETVKEKFFVYGGGCSRSIRLQATFDNVWDACEAAERLRGKDKLNHVTVRTGAHAKSHFGTNANQYKVYSNPCKVWALRAATDSADRAREIAEKLKKDGDRVEIVVHFKG
jgi:hypothetical protein